jgi:RIO kinase 1
MSVDSEVMLALESLFDEGWISELLYEVKSGKEATVYCCRGGPPLPRGVREGRSESRGAVGANGQSSAQSSASRSNALTPDPSLGGRGELLAAKVHRDIRTRRFKNDAIYQTGRVHLAREGRVKRATQNKSSFGREAQYAMWLDHEWQTMHTLHTAGVDVVRPVARNDRAILMPFLGDRCGPAPNLVEAELHSAETGRIADRLLWNIELMLDRHIVHGDLSPYNVLYWRGEATIIDFPQAVDPRLNPAALALLSRDVENICRWASRHGVRRDAGLITPDLWRRFSLGEIG